MIGGRGVNNNEGGPKWVYVTLKSRRRVTSHIFVKEPEGSSEKILKYVNCTYGRVFVPSQKHNFMICGCTIFPTFKLIETERYTPNCLEGMRFFR